MLPLAFGKRHFIFFSASDTQDEPSGSSTEVKDVKSAKGGYRSKEALKKFMNA